jgi:hypothetical protein
MASAPTATMSLRPAVPPRATHRAQQLGGAAKPPCPSALDHEGTEGALADEPPRELLAVLRGLRGRKG